MSSSNDSTTIELTSVRGRIFVTCLLKRTTMIGRRTNRHSSNKFKGDLWSKSVASCLVSTDAFEYHKESRFHHGNKKTCFLDVFKYSCHSVEFFLKSSSNRGHMFEVMYHLCLADNRISVTRHVVVFSLLWSDVGTEIRLNEIHLILVIDQVTDEPVSALELISKSA